MSEEIHKACTGCGKVLPLSQFGVDTKGKLRKSADCKACRLIRRRRYVASFKIEIPPFKYCPGCKQTLAFTYFGKNRDSKHGLTGRCRACIRIRPYKNKKVIQTQATIRSVRLANKRWAQENKEKRIAHAVLGEEMRKGKIQRGACSICGEAKTDGHHSDYNFPTVVTWLCRKHHSAWHRAFLVTEKA